MISQEKSTASNIKDKKVRKDVIIALKAIEQSIKSYGKHKTFDNGIVLIAGCASLPKKNESYF
jgi:peptide subunit release factor 1 (eRF1)